MGYEIDIDPVAHEDIAVLPQHALLPLAEALTLLKVTPWAAPPISREHPDGPVRTLHFGDGGMITALIVEDLRRVDVLTVQWGT